MKYVDLFFIDSAKVNVENALFSPKTSFYFRWRETRVTRTQMWIGCKRRIGAREEELLFSLESMQDVMTTFRSRIAIAVLIDFVDFWWISFLSKWLIEFVLENPLLSWKTIFDHRGMPECKERNYLSLGS